jgi:hypothetical protein
MPVWCGYETVRVKRQEMKHHVQDGQWQRGVHPLGPASILYLAAYETGPQFESLLVRLRHHFVVPFRCTCCMAVVYRGQNMDCESSGQRFGLSSVRNSR